MDRGATQRVLCLCAFFFAVLATVACGGGGGGQAVPPASPAASASPSPSTSLKPVSSPTASSKPVSSPSASPSSSPTAAPTSNVSDIDWPTQSFDIARTGENPNETVLSASTVHGLHLLWSARIAGDTTSKYSNSQPVVAAGVSVGGVPTDIVYTGDEHGYFAAFNAMNGALIWRKSLGSIATQCGDIPDKIFGVTDAATIDHAHNRVYVVDGMGVLWAFDLATGNVAAGWPANGIPVVDDPTVDHVWSGTTLNASSGTLYVATASYCDLNRWHGALRAVNTQTASVAALYYFATGTTTPPGASGPYGGGVWSWGGVSIDASTQDVYAASGNTNPQVSTPASNESITEWNTSLALIANYFPAIGNGDLDFGGNAMLYNAGGSRCVASYRKSGQLFTFDRTNVSAGSVTSWQIGGSGISSPAFSSSTDLVYFNNPNAGALAQGLYALSSGSGCALNQTPVWSVTGVNASYQPISVADGVVYDSFNATLDAFDAHTGAQLWNSGSSVASGIKSGATVVNGRVYVVDWNDTIYAFGL